MSARAKSKAAVVKADKPPKPGRVKEDRPRRALFGRRTAEPRPTAPPDGALIAGYRKPGMSRNKQIMLYAALAATCISWGVMFGLAAPFKIMPLIAPIPLMLLLLIWVLPDGEYAPVGALEPLFLAFMTALILWPNYIAVALPYLPWLTLLRIIGGPMVLILLLCISISPRFRTKLWDILSSDPWIWKLVLAFVVMQTISLGFTERFSLSLNEYIVHQLNHTAIFVISCYLFTIPTFAMRWTYLYLSAGYIFCFFGLWQKALDKLPWVDHIPSIFKIESDLLEMMFAGLARAAIGVKRVQSIATSPLGLAELLGLSSAFALHIVLSRGHLVVRILAAAYLPLILYLIILSDSRLGIVALMGAMLFYTLIWSLRRWTSDRQSLLGPTLVLAYPAFFAAALAASFVVGRLRNAMWGGGAEASSTQSRFVQWEMAWPKILSHPLGHGIGRAAAEVGFRNPAGRGTLDSYYIVLLMDYGILGFLLYLGFFIRGIWIAGQTTVRYLPQGELSLLLPLAVALGNFLVVKSVLVLEPNHPLVFMMLGAIVALTYRVKKMNEANAVGA